MDDNFVKLIKSKAQYFEIDKQDIDLRNLGLDSLGTVELLLDLEEYYNVVFPDDLLIIHENITANIIWSVIQDIKESER
ncbi:acyl carrier protein [Staphylococcus pseudoxylosus]|uniref:phosphopantetheine-binding protein n=1 Tax=Staphylococcus pseudoxylosus TaxID=2282419 RepID=UPI001F3233DB|nr:phosphopantetheine-binding protein [Staphylococcus pseudoxylosus]MCE5003509.1 acyl carrier protein [Staphylococcus pseudoxylosus]